MWCIIFLLFSSSSFYFFLFFSFPSFPFLLLFFFFFFTFSPFQLFPLTPSPFSQFPISSSLSPYSFPFLTLHPIPLLPLLLYYPPLLPFLTQHTIPLTSICPLSAPFPLTSSPHNTKRSNILFLVTKLFSPQTA